MLDLHSGQAAMIKRGMSTMWSRPFTIQTITETPTAADSFYDSPQLQTGSTIASGSWDWRPQDSRRGSEGGLFSKADLILATDLVYSGTLAGPGGNFKAHLVVDGIICTVTSISPYPELGMIVVGAIRRE